MYCYYFFCRCCWCCCCCSGQKYSFAEMYRKNRIFSSHFFQADEGSIQSICNARHFFFAYVCTFTDDMFILIWLIHFACRIFWKRIWLDPRLVGWLNFFFRLVFDEWHRKNEEFCYFVHIFACFLTCCCCVVFQNWSICLGSSTIDCISVLLRLEIYTDTQTMVNKQTHLHVYTHKIKSRDVWIFHRHQINL